MEKNQERSEKELIKTRTMVEEVLNEAEKLKLELDSKVKEKTRLEEENKKLNGAIVKLNGEKSELVVEHLKLIDEKVKLNEEMRMMRSAAAKKENEAGEKNDAGKENDADKENLEGAGRKSVRQLLAIFEEASAMNSGKKTSSKLALKN